MPGLTSKLLPFIVGFIAAVLSAAGVALGVAYSGMYNVAATEPHSALEDWLLHTTMEQSVRARAGSIGAPAPFTQQQVLAGSGDFNAMCVTCHGAPGRERGEVGKGLLPQPPALSRAADRWDREELFWIIKNGIRMTGMPAFGPTHSDEALWNIVAFVQTTRGMTPEQYRALVAQASQSRGAHSHGMEPGATRQHAPSSDATRPKPQPGEEPGHSH